MIVTDQACPFAVGAFYFHSELPVDLQFIYLSSAKIMTYEY